MTQTQRQGLGFMVIGVALVTNADSIADIPVGVIAAKFLGLAGLFVGYFNLVNPPKKRKIKDIALIEETTLGGLLIHIPKARLYLLPRRYWKKPKAWKIRCIRKHIDIHGPFFSLFIN